MPEVNGALLGKTWNYMEDFPARHGADYQIFRVMMGQ